MKVIDGTAFVKIYQPKKLKAFREYCDDELVKVVFTLFLRELIEWTLFLTRI